MTTTPLPRIVQVKPISLPAEYAAFADPDNRPGRVSSRQVKDWIRHWWPDTNADSFLNDLVATGVLSPVRTPFKHKRYFETNAVLVWAAANGA